MQCKKENLNCHEQIWPTAAARNIYGLKTQRNPSRWNTCEAIRRLLNLRGYLWATLKDKEKEEEEEEEGRGKRRRKRNRRRR
jgi:hypothetical protein